MNKLLSLIVLFALVGTTLSAQGQQSSKKHKKSKEHKKELREQHEQNVYPILKAEHDAFDAALSADDLNFLVNKRNEADQLRKEQHNMRKEIKALKKAGSSKEEVKAKFAEQRDNLKAKRKSLMESLKPFAENNEELIHQHMKKIKSYHSGWKEERQSIHKKHLGENFEQIKKHKSERHSKMKKNKSPEDRAKRKDTRMKQKVAKFLLWDGELKKHSKNDKNVDLEEDNLFGEISEENYQLSAYPNPAQNQTTVKFQLNESINLVKVKIADFNAAIRSEILLESLSPGIHTVQLNLSGLEKGQYVIILEADDNKQTISLNIR